MKNFDEFAEIIREKVAVIFEDADVRLVDAKKNNGVALKGILVAPKENNIAPTIYLDGYYEAYCHQEDADLDEVARKIADVIKRGIPKQAIDMEFFMDWSAVRDKICFRIVNMEKNEGSDLVRVPFMDLAVTFFYPFFSDEVGHGSISIKKEHAKNWGVDAAELFARAMDNTPRLYPAEDASMLEVMKEMAVAMFGPDVDPEMAMMLLGVSPMIEDNWMTVLTNPIKMFGAGTIIYPGLLDRMAKKIGGSFYVIPSSVHECILLKDNGTGADNPLSEMICDVNRTQLDPVDVLSDNAYYYDAKERTLSVVGREDLTWNADASVVA